VLPSPNLHFHYHHGNSVFVRGDAALTVTNLQDHKIKKINEQIRAAHSKNDLKRDADFERKADQLLALPKDRLKKHLLFLLKKAYRRK